LAVLAVVLRRLPVHQGLQLFWQGHLHFSRSELPHIAGCRSKAAQTTPAEVKAAPANHQVEKLCSFSTTASTDAESGMERERPKFAMVGLNLKRAQE